MATTSLTAAATVHACSKSAVSQVPRTLEWIGGADGSLRILDQTCLPAEVRFIDCTTPEQVHQAIQRLSVRGAPAIGLAGAFGVCLGARSVLDRPDATLRDLVIRTDDVAAYLAAARPTAVNLAWAIQQIQKIPRASGGAAPRKAWEDMLDAARQLLAADAEICRRIGEHGAELVRDGFGVLTHCNAGALATSQHGTALAVLYESQRRGRKFRVYADETRPLLQGLRLTAFELTAGGIDTTVICDSAAGALMASGAVHMVIVGADRIARNGDTANKIGTYSVAVLAHYHGIPFYVAAPLSTFDLTLASGAEIPIELRSEDEISSVVTNTRPAACGRCHNPAFDVTPAKLIRGIITERGILEPVSAQALQQIFG